MKNGEGIEENSAHFWGKDPSALISSSKPHTLTVGNGLDIYTSTLLPAIEAAEHEVILATCFWSHSDTLSALSESLIRLSRKALARNDGSRIRIRIGFSSRSLLQKLLHTSSPEGYAYGPEEWSSRLGLPRAEALGGLDLEIRSLFSRPFSVMHPKFVIVDKRHAFLPSCNISWEAWLECCIYLDGPIVDTLVEFWKEVWTRGADTDDTLAFSTTGKDVADQQLQVSTTNSPSRFPIQYDLPGKATTTVLLPSPHHASLSLSIPWPFLTPPTCPPTPLNTLLLQLFATAEHSIHLITPNLTSPPVMNALLTALKRGVDVHIITNRRMMVLEQLVTAGTITEICVWTMIRAYTHDAGVKNPDSVELASSLEAGTYRPLTNGKLRIGYYRHGHSIDDPVKVHIKCTLVDDQAIVLGSGNMDRASWYTSQELGVAVFGREVVEPVWNTLQQGLEGRVEEYFGY